ncbi:MAG: FAD-binding oxidoreductase [Holophagales bacterium]|nr:FAD-binding oxidoreductase [Holophagales bacterium]
MGGSTICVLGAGIQGSCLALALARRGYGVDLVDRRDRPMSGTSVNTEGKIHLGFVYANDPRRETHRLMIRGSLSFALGLRRIAEIEPSLYSSGVRFLYAVPRESQLDVAAIEAHFQQVERDVRSIQSTMGPDYLGRRLDRVVRPLSTAELGRHFAPDTVQAAFETAEEAVDTLALAARLRDAIAANPRIRFFGSTRAIDGSIESDSCVRLILDLGGERREERYPIAVNCLWAGRLALDAKLGLAPERPWLYRFKAGIRWTSGAPRTSIPTVTLVHGPFGDVVNYGRGTFYASWYPSFKLAETQGLDGNHLYAALDRVDGQELAREGVRALARYVPGLHPVLEAPPRFQVGGGVIFSWGSTDIDDPRSGLHERWRIGPNRYGPYLSVDTGKYTMAPLFALETGRIVDEILG